MIPHKRKKRLLCFLAAVVIFLPTLAAANTNPLGAQVEALTASTDSAGWGLNTSARAEWAGTDVRYLETADSMNAIAGIGLFSGLPPRYTLNYVAVSGGSISGDSYQTVSRGQDGTPVTAVPHTGFRFLRWSDWRTDNPRTDTNVTGNISVVAIFEPTDFLITNVQTEGYTTGVLHVGALVYVDRTYQFAEPLPPGMEGWAYILTANDNKNTTASLTFYLTRAATVVVAMDSRVPLPSWLQSWQQSGQTLYTTDPQHPDRVLYEMRFEAGWVTLGGNLDPGTPESGTYSMYSVLAGEWATAADNWALYE